MLLTSLISATVGTKLPGMGSIYMSQSFKFLKPAYVGDTVTARVEVLGPPLPIASSAQAKADRQRQQQQQEEEEEEEQQQQQQQREQHDQHGQPIGDPRSLEENDKKHRRNKVVRLLTEVFNTKSKEKLITGEGTIFHPRIVLVPQQ